MTSSYANYKLIVMIRNNDFDYEQLDVLFLMRLLCRKMRTYFILAIEQYDLTSQQGNLLIFLTKKHLNNEIVHQQDIEQYYCLSKSTISGMIDRLEARGLVKRVPDGRYTNIVPTEEAIRVANELRAVVNQYDLNSLSILTEEDQITLKKSVIKLLKYIDNMKEEEKHVE